VGSGCAPAQISVPLVDKNIVEFNDFSYSTVIGCYQLLYIPKLVSFLSDLSDLAMDTVSDLFLLST
jgi:hypothetical protein